MITTSSVPRAGRRFWTALAVLAAMSVATTASAQVCIHPEGVPPPWESEVVGLFEGRGDNDPLNPNLWPLDPCWPGWDDADVVAGNERPWSLPHEAGAEAGVPTHSWLVCRELDIAIL